MRELEISLVSLSLFSVLLLERSHAALSLASLVSVAEDEVKVDDQVEDHEADRYIAEVKGDNRVIHERRVANDRVHNLHQDELVEVLELGTGL